MIEVWKNMKFQNQQGFLWILLRLNRLIKEKKPGAEHGRIKLVLVFQSKQEKKRKEPYSAKENFSNAKFL